MKQNPVYKREDRVAARSLRLPVILAVFNGILSGAALLNLYSAMSQVKAAASIQYTSFMEMYGLVATIEFIMLMFLVPAMTAASLSGERERQTLDLMLTTLLTPFEIVSGKLMSALSTLVLLILSSFPAITMVLAFGGVTWTDIGQLLLCYMAVALFAGSLGVCLSAAFKRSTLATAAAYGMLAAVAAGTYFVNRFALTLDSNRLETYTAYLSGGQATASSGGLVYLLLLNPAATFYVTISGQTGEGGVESLCRTFGVLPQGWVMEHWVGVSAVLQLAVSALLIWLAVRFIDPVRGKGRKRRER